MTSAPVPRSIQALLCRLAGAVFLLGGAVVLLLSAVLARWALSSVPGGAQPHLDPRGVWAVVAVGSVMAAFGIAGLVASVLIARRTPAVAPIGASGLSMPVWRRGTRAWLILGFGLAVLLVAIVVRLHGG